MLYILFPYHVFEIGFVFTLTAPLNLHVHGSKTKKKRKRAAAPEKDIALPFTDNQRT